MRLRRMNAKPGSESVAHGEAAEATAGNGEAWLFDIVNLMVAESRLILRPVP
jgi:hypothetical protein